MIGQLTPLYLGDLERRNYSPRTLENQAYGLGHLGRFLKIRAIGDVAGVSESVLIEFQKWLFYQPTPQGQARSFANQNRILAVVKGFFKFLKREGHIPRDPAEPLEYAREQRHLPRDILTPREAKRIIEAVDISTANGYRDRTVLEVFYSTGIRVAELIALRLTNVNLEDEILRINNGKGGRDRVVPLSQMACKHLENYINGIRPCCVIGKNTDRLFVSWRGKPLDRSNLNLMMKRHARKAGVKKHLTCHIWRHSCATHLLKNNANLRHVQEILGHKSLATTELYLRVTISDLKEAHRKYHPRENGKKAR